MVRPDAFYRDFISVLMAEPLQSPASVKLLEEALDRTEESPYELWRWEEPLGNGAR